MDRLQAGSSLGTRRSCSRTRSRSARHGRRDLGRPASAHDGGGGPQKGNWAGFFQLGVNAPVGEIVWDLSYRTFMGGRSVSQEVVFVRDAGMSEAEAITQGLQSVVTMFGGYVESATRRA